MMKRLFIGIPVYADLANEKARLWQNDRQLNQNRMVWVKPENWHITLFFLGDTPVSEIPLLQKLMDESFNGIESVQTELKGVGLFPDLRNPKVLWLGLSTIQTLIPARNLLGEKLVHNGFNFDNKPLRPHLTIARIKNLEHRESLKNLLQQHQDSGFGSVLLNRVILFESVLTPNGPVYRSLYEKKLL